MWQVVDLTTVRIFLLRGKFRREPSNRKEAARMAKEYLGHTKFRVRKAT